MLFAHVFVNRVMLRTIRRLSCLVACIWACAGVVTGCDNADALLPPAVVPKFDAVFVDGVGQTDARLGAVVSNAAMLTSFGFGIQTEGGSDKRILRAGLFGDTVFASADNLSPETTYRFWAEASNGGGITISSDSITFKTAAIPQDTVPEIPTDTVPVAPVDTISVVPQDTVKADTGYVVFKSSYLERWLVLRYDKNNDDHIDGAEAKSIAKIEIGTDNVTSLGGIEALGNLGYLHAEGTRDGNVGLGQLEEVDLTHNPQLYHLCLNHNNIRKLDFSANPRLVDVYLCMNLLDSIDLSTLHSLSLIDLEYNNLHTVDFRGLNNLREIHIDGCIYLESMQFDNRLLDSFTCTGCPMLTEIDLSKCPLLNGADLTDCGSLKKIKLSRKQVLGALRIDPGVIIEYVDE